MYGFDYGWGNISTQKLMADKARATNLPCGNNPTYASTDFLSFFPQFTAVCTSPDGGTTPPQVPDVLLQNFIDRANASLSYSRYFDNWTYCMGLFIAHNITLFLSASQSTTPTGIISGAEPVKPTSSESVGDVSASYETSAMTDDAQGWGVWKTTTYGAQLIPYFKLAGMGGMLV